MGNTSSTSSKLDTKKDKSKGNPTKKELCAKLKEMSTDNINIFDQK